MTFRRGLTEDGVEAFTQELKHSSTFSNADIKEVDEIMKEFG